MAAHGYIRVCGYAYLIRASSIYLGFAVSLLTFGFTVPEKLGRLNPLGIYFSSIK